MMSFLQRIRKKNILRIVSSILLVSLSLYAANVGAGDFDSYQTHSMPVRSAIAAVNMILKIVYEQGSRLAVSRESISKRAGSSGEFRNRTGIDFSEVPSVLAFAEDCVYLQTCSRNVFHSNLLVIISYIHARDGMKS